MNGMKQVLLHPNSLDFTPALSLYEGPASSREFHRASKYLDPVVGGEVSGR